MPSHHHPRRRSNKDSDDLSVRAEESHAGPYSRLSNDSRQTSNYRRTDSTSNSGRSSYDMNRASSSSRAHRETSWRPKDTENRYGDDYYRRRGEEHDVAKSREPESWPAQTVPEPRYSEREWQGYDTGYSTASYSESSSWAVPASTTVDHRNGHQERWQSHDYRGGHARGSARAPERTQTQVVEQRRDWAQDQRRGKVPDHDKWAGSVWDSARVENRANAWVEPPPRWNAPPEKKTLLDTRAWEPAPTWQPSGSGERQNYRNQNAPRNDYYNIKTSVSGRRGASTPNTNATYRNHNHTNNKPQRDWRNDDGNPNKCVAFATSFYVFSNFLLQLESARKPRVRAGLGIFILHSQTPPITNSFSFRLTVACRIILLASIFPWPYTIPLRISRIETTAAGP
ncbi:hypothetical protein DFH07DRAFT_953576 [Mycena maculata]|uniref:Uncharacterized protein n=1 Tax=Mycena maculata TaxID=230809 RepID=A0AAD7NQY2_9AGAR|nr:hypothetical protein DFH07DRAFT_953576 [Mycena maculata]